MNAPPRPHEAGPVTVGVDLGGTGTRIVVLDADGTVRRETSSPTAAGISPTRAAAELADSIAAAAAGFALRAVGIGASGPVDRLGVIRNPDTLPAYSDIPITDIISDRLGIGCVIDNDAVTAAIGEHNNGAGRGSDTLLVVTLGTGIGVALFCHGHAARAADGSHPEAGHLAVNGPSAPCYCGLPTCWEQLASRTALDRLTGNRSAELAIKARTGDPDAAAVFDVYGRRVGAGLGTLLTLLKPDRVVIGGGAARYLDLAETGMRRSLRRAPGFTAVLELRAAELGNLAGAIGAAILARRTA
ncbi:ROK family protein [Pseudonocardia sp. Cha107L01]|uniref:ROK family protein n=1 Tax=Pseudonocardia sp. Cha107L01 TaxID=3457576 RepID=UPI00403EEE3F